MKTPSPTATTPFTNANLNSPRPRLSGITGDTLVLTVVSICLQGFSLLLNVLVTRRLGEAAIGILSLVFSFYGFVLILSNGNIFTSTSRFVSEEIGKGSGNPEGILKYALCIGVGLSSVFALLIWIFGKSLAQQFLGSQEAYRALRLLGLSLPLATVGSCLKGYFHSRRMVKRPCIGDIIESIVKFTALITLIQGIAPSSDLKAQSGSVLMAVSVSMILGEVASCIYLTCAFILSGQDALSKKNSTPSISSLYKYFFSILPIMVSGYTFVVLSGTNEALVPLTLKFFSGSAQTALEQYGIFEGIVLQVLFFPAIILQSLSVILIPEFARTHAAGNQDRVRYLAKRVMQEGLWLSCFVSTSLLALGGTIGRMACGDDPLPGKTLRILSAVIPFIYLEILMEGMLKGMGKQNFCTINSAVEYIIRITCVVIFVPMVGFWGVIISYFASNITCNLIRIHMLKKTTGVYLDLIHLFLKPMLICLGGSVAAIGGCIFIDTNIPWLKIFWFLLISGAITCMLRFAFNKKNN